MSRRSVTDKIHGRSLVGKSAIPLFATRSVPPRKVLNRRLIESATMNVWASSNLAIIPCMMSKSCSGVVAGVTLARAAATMAGQSAPFSSKRI